MPVRRKIAEIAGEVKVAAPEPHHPADGEYTAAHAAGRVPEQQIECDHERAKSREEESQGYHYRHNGRRAVCAGPLFAMVKPYWRASSRRLPTRCKPST